MIKKLECKRCGHKWNPQTENPKPISCPRCKSYHWDKEKEKR